MSDAIAEPPITPQRPPPFINASNAAAMAKLSAQAKAAKKLALSTSAPLDPYVAERISRVRMQIERLDALLEATDEPRELDAISRAIERLAKLECYLANRPGPGNLKPTAPRKATNTPVEPLN